MQLLEGILDHVLGGGLVADHDHREPDQARWCSVNNSVTERTEAPDPGVADRARRSSGVPGLRMTSAELMSTY